MRHLWLSLARVVWGLHAAFTLALALSPVACAVWGVPALIVTMVAGLVFFLLNRLDRRRRCPVTVLEFSLRARGGDSARMQGLVRRLLVRLLRRDVPESAASLVAYAVAAEALLLGVLVTIVREVLR